MACKTVAVQNGNTVISTVAYAFFSFCVYGLLLLYFLMVFLAHPLNACPWVCIVTRHTFSALSFLPDLTGRLDYFLGGFFPLIDSAVKSGTGNEREKRWGVDRRNDIRPDSNTCPP